MGGILRDDKGDLIMAFYFPIQCSTSTFAKALAAKFETKWCTENVLAITQMIADKKAIE